MSQPPDPEENHGLAGMSLSARLWAIVEGGRFGRYEPALRFFTGRLSNNHISSAAAALSYSTTLALIPAIALVLASLAVFPAFNSLRLRIQGTILRNLMPDTGLQISQALTNFIDAAGKLTIVGVVGLASTAILLLLTIEGQLNLIFGVVRERPLLTRVLVLLLVMTVGPLLLALGVSLFGAFDALHLFQGPGMVAATFLLGHIAPSVITWALLSFIYVVVPHNHVRWRDAMIGAVYAAVSLAAIRYTFAFYIRMLTSYQAIYGAMAAVPVFLLWIYAVWFLVMAGAMITAGLPDWRQVRSHRARGPVGRLVLALEVIAALTPTRGDGQGRTARHLAKVTQLPINLVLGTLEVLCAGHFVARGRDDTWTLSRDPDSTPLADLVHHFDLGLDACSLQLSDPSAMARRLDGYLDQAAESEQRLLSVSLAHVIGAEAQK